MSDRRFFYPSHADVRVTACTMAKVVETAETVFRATGEIRVEMPPKPGIYASSGDSFIYAMLTCTPALGPPAPGLT